ncbi:hypothetical protein CC1G_11019 [Coprinopsis cinerea okayama7|uniref:Uncharacterized protein n=1 Tax=Coprinopsis cinerea (strain Okayama-7 / 130 / ATCC MYA-4618 / FGSC 9003) TaxID=240176 RepID=A8NIQ7_COPC7|nr:hypothetical protein CC1G_11019 [Coprinopsis cinerea okayama7\|eukprot:XP_001834049.1 hypothetical protein CC1G_11019 [Coprinopsis cinerea okayama7\
MPSLKFFAFYIAMFVGLLVNVALADLEATGRTRPKLARRYDYRLAERALHRRATLIPLLEEFSTRELIEELVERTDGTNTVQFPSSGSGGNTPPANGGGGRGQQPGTRPRKDAEKRRQSLDLGFPAPPPTVGRIHTPPKRSQSWR